MVTENDPAGEGETDVEEGGADEEAEHVGGRPLHGEYEDVVSLEEAEISQYSEPDQAVASSQHQTERR